MSVCIRNTTDEINSVMSLSGQSQSNNFIIAATVNSTSSKKKKSIIKDDTKEAAEPVKRQTKTVVAVAPAPAPLKRDEYALFMKEHTLNKKDNQSQVQSPSQSPTNTRIGNTELKIYGASYMIPQEKYEHFLDLYFKEVFQNKKEEYITEKQLDDDGPLLVDIDLRFSLDQKERFYSIEHTEDLIDSYIESIQKIYEFNRETTFNIFVLEKEKMNPVQSKNLVKDGIHIIFGIKMDHPTQEILRIGMIEILKEIWSDFPIINTWDDVLDKGISEGTTNWQLYGSKKPGNEPYKLTHVYNVYYEDGDLARRRIDKNIFLYTNGEVNPRTKELSARYTGNLLLPMRESFAELRKNNINEGKLKSEKPKRENTKQNSSSKTGIDDGCVEIKLEDVFKIETREELDMFVNKFLDSLNDAKEYVLKDAHNYVMTLPATYYGNGSYANWIRVGWALKNISNRLFIVFLKFSSQSETFHFSESYSLYEQWTKFDYDKENPLTIRSIIFWSKRDAPEKYEKVRENTLDYFIEATLGNTSSIKLTEEFEDVKFKCGDYDLAKLLYHYYKDEYICVSVKNNIWFVYRNHRWVENDSGTSLRRGISENIRKLYQNMVEKLYKEVLIEKSKEPGDEKKIKMLGAKIFKISEIEHRLITTSDKKNIMHESRDLFYDEFFYKKLDTNPYLLCFNNGVIDFKTKEFRKGYPEDYISKTTDNDYIPFYNFQGKPVVNEIHDFMGKLFPEKELLDYMWEHLASTLIGASKNQTFNMYIGVGQNGKSVLVSLMERVLGEYKGDVPLSIVTDKRTQIGGLAPELVALKGVRYAVMQEPSKGDKMNEGVMKQITSGIDPIQARAPYMPQSVTYIPQFKLVVCSNELMEITSQDHGTWRRIRVVEYKSLFVENPVQGNPDKPYQFLLNKDIKERFNDWKEPFISMLVDIAFRTEGNVTDCAEVLKASNEYKNSQNYCAEFVSDKIIRLDNYILKKETLNNTFSEWYIQNRGYKPRNSDIRDIHKYMDLQFKYDSKYKGWKGVSIVVIQPVYEEEQEGLEPVTYVDDDEM